MGHALHKTGREMFNSKLMAKNYLQLYEKILNGVKINKEIPVYKEIEI